MSSIDERIVQMKFDNGQFQKGAAETIGTMAELKRMFMFEGMAQGIENISSKFNAFGAIGFTVLQNLTNAAIQFGRDIAGAVLDPLIEGGKKRALNIEQAKFQFKGLGLDVEAVMADALYAVKNTAFGLDEAAVAAAQFGASGVQAGDEMKAALRGISGVAAMAGTSYSDIASVFTKVAGQGRLMGDDLNRLGVRGINAASTLAKAMGTTEEAVREMVTEGKISFELFSQVMSDAFGEHATKANETYTGSLSNMRAALSRIGAEFATIDNEEKRQMFNAMTPAIDNVAKALKPVVDIFKEFKAQSADNFVKIFEALNTVDIMPAGFEQFQKLPPLFQSLKNILTAVTTVLRPIRDAFNDVFPPVLAEVILDLGKHVEKFTEGLILSEQQVSNLKSFFVSFFTVIKNGLAIIGGVIKFLGNLVRIAWELGGALLGLISPLITFIKSLLPVSDGVDDASASIMGFFDWMITLVNYITGPLIAGLRVAGDGLDQFFNGGGLVNGIKNIISWIGKLLGSVGAMSDALFKGDTSGGGFFGSDSKFLGVLAKIREVIIDLAKRSADFFVGGAKGAGDFFKAIGDGIAAAFKGLDIDWNFVLAALNTGILGAIGVMLFKNIGKIVSAFADFKSIKDSFAGVLDSVAGALDRFNAEVKPNWADQMIKIGVALLLLAGAVAIMSMVNPDNMVSSLTGLGVAMGILIATMYGMDKLDLQPTIKASIAISLLAFSLNILASAVVKMAGIGWEELGRGLTGLVIVMGFLVLMMDKMPDEKKILGSAFAMVIIAGAIYALAGAVAIFGAMPLEMLVQGGVAVGVAIGVMVAAAAALNKWAPKMVLSAVGLMAMAAAINMLLVPLTALGLLPQEILQQGFGMLTLLLGMMIGMAALLGKAGPQMALGAVGLMAMAFAINLLVIPLIALGMMDWGVLNQGVVGLAVVMLLLVVAANLMQKAMPGTLAMIAMSAAILILSVALLVLSAIPVETLFGIVGALAALFAVILIAGAVTAGITVPLLIFTGIILALSIALLIVAGAFMVMALSLGVAATGMMALFGVLVMFSEQAGVILGMTGPMVVLGLALIALGAGALVAGAGFLLLGVGLALLSVGLLLIATTGVLGLVALTAVINGLMKLMEHVPGMFILGGAFTVLGAGVLVLGAGMLVLAAAVILAAVGLMMLIPLGALVTLSIEMIMKAISKAADKADKVSELVAALQPLGKVLSKVGDGAAASVVAVVGITVAFVAMTVAAVAVGLAVTGMANLIGSNVPKALGSVMAVGLAFQLFILGLVAAIKTLGVALSAATPIVIAATTAMAMALLSNTARVLSGGAGGMYSAGYSIGIAVTDGMRIGIQNGSARVSAAAAQVAAAALRSSKRELGVASPSKEYYKVGNWMDEGLADGQLDNVHKVETASEKVGKAALEAMRESLSQAKNAIASDMSLQPTIKPVLDMTNVTAGVGAMSSMFNGQTLRLGNNRAMAASTSSAINQTTEERATDTVPVQGTTVNLTQNNYSPKTLPESEIYRNTRSLIPRIKEDLDKP